MEMRTNRSFRLKQRILSDVGHLCNEDSAFASLEIIGDKTKEIVLAHLSEEANDPCVALDTYMKVFKDANISLDNIQVYCANQHHSVEGGK